ncbi:MAG: hypothetical protein WAW92_04360 [Minisyncoccia bacterium]
MKSIYKFFDKLEDKTRAKLSRMPIIYALIGAIGVVLFWRGVWHLADELNVGSLVSVIIGTTILLVTGAFVSTFIGSRLIISGLSGEKKLTEKAKEEIKNEEDEIESIKKTLEKIEKEIDEISSKVN